MEIIKKYKDTEYKITVIINDIISITLSTYHDNTVIHKYYRKYEIEFTDIEIESEDKKLEDYLKLYENRFFKFIDCKIYHEIKLSELGFN